MVSAYFFVSLFTLLPLVRSSPTNIFGNLIIHEQRDTVPDGFVNAGAAPANQTLNLRIGLTQGNMTGLAQKHAAVSTPGATDYGQHLSKEEVEGFVRPTNETTAIVNEWLVSNGLNATNASPAADWLSVSMPVNKASILFDAEFSVFTYESTDQQIVRTLAYSVPTVLSGHIEFVHPMTSFDAPSSQKPVVTPSSMLANSTTRNKNLTSRAVPSPCTQAITPACLQNLYSIPTTKATQSSNSIGVTGFENDFANQADLTMFLGGLRSDIPSSTTFSQKMVDGGENSQTRSGAGPLANINMQYTVGLATGVPATFISVGEPSMDGFLDVSNFLLTQTNPPHVVMTSYNQNEKDISRAVANNLCNVYMQLGARGISVLFSSGDGGVSGVSAASCTSFVPTFPSTCPFVTSVGATTGIAPEKAASFSSGGFSNYFAVPAYQAGVVNTFLESLAGSSEVSKFNRTGRGFPDVAAQGENIEFVLDAERGSATSSGCSSPIFASVIALLNDELISSGKPPLGFLNPILYTPSFSATFNDIVSGSNTGCNSQGFTARKGWDPVTGLGTPNFAKLRAALGLP